MASQELGASLNSVEGAIWETGPYVFRSLLKDIPLSANGDQHDVRINCVEFFGEMAPSNITLGYLLDPDGNLYVGTSASEILHFVQIPPESDDAFGKPTYILASRLPPAYAEPSTSARPGVQQILLLPKVNKACILCNWTVTFYSLPELSPVFGTAQLRPCNWIGGVDLDVEASDTARDGRKLTTVVLVSLNKKMRVVRIGDDARSLKVRHIYQLCNASMLIILQDN